MAKKREEEDLRSQSGNELAALLVEVRQELFELRNQLMANKKLDKPHLVYEKRKKIARIKTFLREKQEEVLR